ncbi:hypothetical protein [Streptomyces sp. NPDC091649]|uniref:hypothetical protein n=1 Tax=Streptomyces sp. NPDC091649 TaxID=3366004 RepID=UPI00382BE3CE
MLNGAADPAGTASVTTRLTVDPVAVRLRAAVRMTPYAGRLSRATMPRWTDAVPARELGIGLRT